MNTTAMPIKPGRRKIGGLALTIALAAAIGGLSLAVPARADDDRGRNVQHGHDQGHGDHAERERRDHHPAPAYYREPAYVYAPPPVYYAPPEPSPGLSLIIPLNFR